MTAIGRRGILLAGLLCAAASSDFATVPARAGSDFVEMNIPSETLDLGIADMDGQVHALKDYRGKVLVVSFWATWCPPCRKEMPSLARLSRALPPDRFSVVAVNMGDRRDRVETFLGEIDHAGLPVLLDEKNALATQWYLRGLPVTYILDPSGDLRLGVFGARDWDNPEITDQIVALGR